MVISWIISFVRKRTFFSEGKKWKELWAYHELEDVRFEELIQSCIDDVENKNVEDVLDLLQVVGILFTASRLEIYEIDKSYINKISKECIDYMKENYGQLTDDKTTHQICEGRISIDSSDGLGFHSLDDEWFVKVRDYAFKSVKEKQEDNINNIIVPDLLSMLVNGDNNFFRELVSMSNQFGKYYSTEMLNRFDVNQVLDILLNGSNKTRSIFSTMVGKRYEGISNDTKEILKSEKEWLITLQDKLKDEVDKYKWKRSYQEFKYLYETVLPKAIKKLSETEQ